MRITLRYIAVVMMITALVFAASCKKQAQEGGPSSGPSVAPTTPSAPSGPTGTATITGVVTFKGAAPKPKKLDISADPYCVSANPGGLTVNPVQTGPNGALREALVYVKSGISGPYAPPSTPVILDQENCWYKPTLVALQAGQPLEIKNSDKTTHNVRADSRMSNSFNISEAPAESKTKTLEKPEQQIPVTCDVHPWMKGFLFVFPHPFFSVSGDDGKFKISGLPAGEYEIEVWHPELGATSQKVTVTDGQSVEASFTLGAKS
ncbi:MAG: carboxypeptidase regulatory-like domain-containing protein [bacterium JZ-2024 1]